MKVCLVGGIFDRPDAIRSKHLVTPETVLLEGLRSRGVDVHPIGHAGFQPSDDYDLVHVHHFGRAAMTMASSRCRGRFVFTGHNGQIVTGWEKSRLRRYAFQYVVDQADAVVALSQAEANYFAGVTAAEKVRIIPNGIPAAVFSADDRRRKPGDEPHDHVLYVGQLIELKGVNVLLEALARLLPFRPVKLRLVYHNAQLEADLKRQSRDLGIAEHVEFVGICGPAELAEEYRRADLLVLPSFAECLPSVITEALLCGTPVVASAVCGVPEQIGSFGMAVPPGDSQALAAAMKAVLADRPHYQSLTSAMQAYAQRKFHPDAMVADHLALYRDILDGQIVPSQRPTGVKNFAVRLAVDFYWAKASRRLRGQTR